MRRLLLLGTLPYLAAVALLSAGLSGVHTWQNGYLSQDLHYAAAVQCWQRLQLDGGHALCVLALLLVPALLLQRVSRRQGRALVLVIATQLSSLVLLADLSEPGRSVTERFGVVLPSELWWAFRMFHEKGILPVAWLATGGVWLLLMGLGTLWLRRRPAGAPPAVPRRLVGACWAVILGIAGASLATERGLRPDPGERLPSIVFVTWDSLRADRLSLYGHDVPTSPHLDRFAADAVVFEDATSQHNWTRPSYASILTSRYQWEIEGGSLSPVETTLAESLQNAGYETWGVVQNPMLDPHFHFSQGFDFYYQVYFEPSPDAVNEVVRRRLMAPRDRPLFLFVHYLRPHYPYPEDDAFVKEFVSGKATTLSGEEVMEIFRTHGKDTTLEAAQVDYLRGLYDATIRSTDAAFGELLEILRESVDLDAALVVFNSDHGDEFFEHGRFGHAHENLHPEVLGIPLVMRFPAALGIAPARIREPVMNLDIGPTLLEVAGAALPGASGRSLLPLARGQQIAGNPIYSTFGKMLAVRLGRYKLIAPSAEPGGWRAYDLQEDPGETQAIPLDSVPELVALQRLADEWMKSHASDGAAPASTDHSALNPALQRDLEALGYVHTEPGESSD